MSTCSHSQRITRAVHTNRDNANAVFHVAKRIRISDWTTARGSLVVSGSTGDVKVTASIRDGDYEAALDAATPSSMVTSMRDANTTETEIQGILSNSDTTVTRNPMTPAMPSTLLKWLKVSAWFAASTGLKGRPYVEFSDDGVVWNNAKELQTTYWTAAGWNFPTDPVNIYALTSTTPRRFCRFGLETLNTTASSTTTELAQARLRIDMVPVIGGTLSTYYALVHTQGSTSVATFVPLLEDMGTELPLEVRRTLEIACSTGDVTVQFAYQLPPFADWPSKDCFPRLRDEYYDHTRKEFCCENVPVTGTGDLPCALPSPEQLDDARERYDLTWASSVPLDDLSLADRRAWDHLFATAWALVQANLGLVRWICCYFAEMLDSTHPETAGWSAFADCLEDLFSGSGTVHLKGENWQEYPDAQYWVDHDPTTMWGVLHFTATSGAPPREEFEAWSAAQTDDERLCVALDIAQTLLHELMHNCGELHDDLADCACEFQPFVGRAWADAVEKRYGDCLRGCSRVESAWGDGNKCPTP